MFQLIALILGVPVLAVLGLAATKPATFKYERKASINANPDKVFALINDLHRWTIWSPWEGKDPDMKRTYSGSESGVGAIYEWDGNKDVGTGRMEILQSVEPSKIVIKLDFLKPFEGHNTAEFTVDPTGESCTVNWSMRGDNNLMGKVMSVFMDMDKMIGNDFEIGLAKLKRAAEA